MIAIWLFTPMTSCQVPHIHVITTCNVLCHSPQKGNGEARREGYKLLPSAKRIPFHLWGLDERGPCHSWNSSMHGAPNPSFTIPAESPTEARSKGHPVLGPPEPGELKSKHARSLKSLPPCLWRALPALCLLEPYKPKSNHAQRPNSPTVTRAFCSSIALLNDLDSSANCSR